MTDRPSLDTTLLEPYLKCMKHNSTKYNVTIKLASYGDHFSFTIGMDLKEEKIGQALPQREIYLHQHDGVRGHEGVHIQVRYHAIENDMNIGQIHISLDIEDDEDLLNTAEGFIYTVYEIMKSSEPELSEIADEIFNVELLPGLIDKKYLLSEKLRASYAQKKVEVRDQSKEGIRILTPEDFAPLLETRKELVPLLGGIVSE